VSDAEHGYSPCGLHLYAHPVDRCQLCDDFRRAERMEPMPVPSPNKRGGFARWTAERRAEAGRHAAASRVRFGGPPPNAKRYVFEGRTVTLRDLAERPDVKARGITQTLIGRRIQRRGWSIAKAIAEPPDRKRGAPPLVMKRKAP
jgi:hypothetical protein